MRNVTRNGGWKTPDWRETSGFAARPPSNVSARIARCSSADHGDRRPQAAFRQRLLSGTAAVRVVFSLKGPMGRTARRPRFGWCPVLAAFLAIRPAHSALRPTQPAPGGCLCSGGIRHAFRREVRLHQDERLELFDVSATLRQATRPEGISTWFFLRFPGISLRTRKSAANHSHAIHCRQ